MTGFVVRASKRGYVVERFGRGTICGPFGSRFVAYEIASALNDNREPDWTEIAVLATMGRMPSIAKDNADALRKAWDEAGD